MPPDFDSYTFMRDVSQQQGTSRAMVGTTFLPTFENQQRKANNQCLIFKSSSEIESLDVNSKLAGLALPKYSPNALATMHMTNSDQSSFQDNNSQKFAALYPNAVPSIVNEYKSPKLPLSSQKDKKADGLNTSLQTSPDTLNITIKE